MILFWLLVVVVPTEDNDRMVMDWITFNCDFARMLPLLRDATDNMLLLRLIMINYGMIQVEFDQIFRE